MTCKDCIHYEVCKEDNPALTGHALIESTAEVCDYFKDKSSFIEFPLKVGDKIYRIIKVGKFQPFIQEEKVINIAPIYRNVMGSFSEVDVDDLGNSVFLTSEEAEKALAKRKGGDE